MQQLFFLPKQMSVEEAEERYLDLVRRLSSFPETLRRSAIMNPFIAIHILFMNIEFRREYKAMVTAHVKKWVASFIENCKRWSSLFLTDKICVLVGVFERQRNSILSVCFTLHRKKHLQKVLSRIYFWNVDFWILPYNATFHLEISKIAPSF